MVEVTPQMLLEQMQLALEHERTELATQTESLRKLRLTLYKFDVGDAAYELARAEALEHTSNGLARIREARAHLALLSAALRTFASQPKFATDKRHGASDAVVESSTRS